MNLYFFFTIVYEKLLSQRNITSTNAINIRIVLENSRILDQSFRWRITYNVDDRLSLARGQTFPLPWEVQVALSHRTVSNRCSFTRRQVLHDPGQGSPLRDFTFHTRRRYLRSRVHRWTSIISLGRAKVISTRRLHRPIVCSRVIKGPWNR